MRFKGSRGIAAPHLSCSVSHKKNMERKLNDEQIVVSRLATHRLMVDGRYARLSPS
jgi:hypothetical protein